MRIVCEEFILYSVFMCPAKMSCYVPLVKHPFSSQGVKVTDLQQCHCGKGLSEEQRTKLQDGADFGDFVSGDADMNGYHGDLKLQKGMKRQERVGITSMV